MRNREHQNLYEDRMKIKSKNKVLKNQNKKLDELADMFKKKNKKLLQVHKEKAQKEISTR